MAGRSIILDTDIDMDCDDVGALAVLHALVTLGEAHLIGVVCSMPFRGCVTAVRAINGWYGREAIPVGGARVDDYETSPAWEPYRRQRERFVAGELGAREYHTALVSLAGERDPDPEEAVSLYRRLLSRAADGSVTICAVGTLTVLAQLLDSGPDAESPRSGAELIHGKVRELVTMAIGTFPEGCDEFNWKMDPASAAQVLQEWPGPVTVSEHGLRILTGARFMAVAPPGHPVREAYRAYLGGADRNRPSWDLVAAAYAVRGLDGPFALSGGRDLRINAATGHHAWSSATGRTDRRYVAPIMDAEAMARSLEDLMIASLSPTRTR